MHCVYRLQSTRAPERGYVGSSADLRQRLRDHNQGCCDDTRPFRPWQVVFDAAFREAAKARAFEAYLKSGSGIAFGQKRLVGAGRRGDFAEPDTPRRVTGRRTSRALDHLRTESGATSH
jgi:predicted GIY-YIG superfamily endonuclease